MSDATQPRFVHNASGKFESRWVTLGIEGGNPAVLLKVMRGCMTEKRGGRGESASAGQGYLVVETKAQILPFLFSCNSADGLVHVVVFMFFQFLLPVVCARAFLYTRPGHGGL